MVKEIEKGERKGYITGALDLSPKYDKIDADEYIHTFYEVVPGIMKIIRNYDKYSAPLLKIAEELKLLTQQKE